MRFAWLHWEKGVWRNWVIDFDCGWGLDMALSIEHIPLLQMQQELHNMPRGMERFRSYLRQMLNDSEDDVEFAPLMSMNPMGREHVAKRLDAWLALGAEEVAHAVVQEAMARLPAMKGYFRHGLVVVDDVRGGWTNHYATDARQRIGVRAPDPSSLMADSKSRHNWISTMLWVSEEATAERLYQSLRQSMLVNIYRIAYLQQHDMAQTLGELMAQEGAAAAFAGITPHLDADDVAYSREILQPLLGESAHPILMAALYGDEAARMLGYEPLGLSNRAGFAVAVADALAQGNLS